MTLKDFFYGFRTGAELFGENIARIINTTLLAFVYIFGVGLTWILSKILKKEFIDEKYREKTYWRSLDMGNEEPEDYYRQF